MNHELRDHQRSLIDLLVSSPTSTAFALEAPTGTGAQTALAAAAAEVANRGQLVLVVTPLRILADQWVARLEAHGVDPIQEIRGGSDLRLALSRDQNPWPDHGAVVATDRGLGTGSIAQKVDLQPDLLILDQVDNISPETVETLTRLCRHAKVTVARTNTAVPAWFKGAATIRWAPDEVVPNRRERYTVRTVPYEVGLDEGALILRAAAFLDQFMPPLPPESLSRRDVYVRLSQLEVHDVPTAPSQRRDGPGTPLDDAQAAELTALLEAFDDLDLDPRLSQLGRLVKESLDEQNPTVVILENLTDFSYVVGYLLDLGIAQVLDLSSRCSPEEAASNWQALREGIPLVASRGMITAGEELPSGCRSIWWDLPRSQTEAEQRLGVGFSNWDIKICALVPEPRLAADPLFVDGLA
ncbi:hypothetical protein ACE2AJ_14585 [Aquihabitans daechungensis]|uniref:hypothetical protein n=1 Tax=Aquihabitans daechungensis TaxID=1052257 RepID=UPI003BA15AD7